VASIAGHRKPSKIAKRRGVGLRALRGHLQKKSVKNTPSLEGGKKITRPGEQWFLKDVKQAGLKGSGTGHRVMLREGGRKERNIEQKETGVHGKVWGG